MMAAEPGTKATWTPPVSPSLKPAPFRAIPLRFLVAVLVTGFLLTVVAMRWQGTRKISHIAVSGTVLIPPHEIIERVSLPHDSLTINEMSFSLIEKRVQSHPFVKSVSAFRSSGDAIMLRIQERTPIAHVLYKGKQYYVDTEGAILPYRLVSTLDIPVIALFGRSTLDSATLHSALIVLEALNTQDKELARNISEVQVRPMQGILTRSEKSENSNANRSAKIEKQSEKQSEFTLITASGATPVLFGSADDANAKVARLSTFWRASSAQVAKKTYAYIDIRWSGQVVTQPLKSLE